MADAVRMLERFAVRLGDNLLSPVPLDSLSRLDFAGSPGLGIATPCMKVLYAFYVKVNW